ncbi:MAG: hypothetical protein JNK82_02705 [Myxococcaceae bacterium]|nr:hypothetical protein [Myxococcaceae bacterium]
MSVVRLLRIEREATLGGVLAGGLTAVALMSPWWVVLLAMPWFTYFVVSLAHELREGRLSTFSLAFMGELALVSAT